MGFPTVGAPNLKINMFFNDKEPIDMLAHPSTLTRRHGDGKTQVDKQFFLLICHL